MNVFEALIIGAIIIAILCWLVPGFSALLLLYIIFCVIMFWYERRALPWIKLRQGLFFETKMR